MMKRTDLLRSSKKKKTTTLLLFFSPSFFLCYQEAYYTVRFLFRTGHCIWYVIIAV